MAEKHLTVKLTLTQLAENRFRSRIEQSPLGASNGAGHDFELTDQQLKDIQSQTAVVPLGKVDRSGLAALGKQLFNCILAGDVFSRYQSCVAVASERGARLRLALTVLPEKLLAIPWEYLHDGANFLLKQNQAIVRVIDELRSRQAPFGPIQRILIALANPKNSPYEEFDADMHLLGLQGLINRLPGIQADILMPATINTLREKLSDNVYDALYFVGHGRFSPGVMGQIILEKPSPTGQTPPDGNNSNLPTDDPLDADIFAQWLSQRAPSERVRFVYLNSCSTATTSEENPFSGVAQRLMRDGEIAAVVAMQTPVIQTAGMEIASGFFDELRRGNSPERAMSLARSRAGDYYSWGVPVIYSQLSGPEEFDKNRIAFLLSANIGKSSYGIFLPTFRRGIPVENYERTKVTMNPPTYSYPGETFSRRDMESAWEILKLLSQVARHDEIHLESANDRGESECSHWFLFGSKSNKIVEGVLDNYHNHFQFDYRSKEYPGKWVLHDLKYGRAYPVTDPSTLGSDEYWQMEDYGVIEKIIDEKSGRVFFLFSGLGDRATRGCGWYFANRWEELLSKFGGDEFGVILKFPRKLEFNFAEPVDRESPESESQLQPKVS